MKNMTLIQIAKACGGTYFGDAQCAEKEVSSVVIDSRKIQKDSLFVAIRGARVDGHNFIPQTIEAGALCAVSEKNLGEVSYPYILVNSCTQALKDIAEHYRKSLNIKVVGISGSVGKTSTKEMIASVLAQKYNVLKTEGNFNNEIGLPLTVFNIREEHEVAVLEMGISDFGEMTRLAKVARPDICVFTNIGYAHLEQLKSRDGILKAKTEMLKYMNPDGVIIMNGDDEKLAGFKPENGKTPVYFGLECPCAPADTATALSAEDSYTEGLGSAPDASKTSAGRYPYCAANIDNQGLFGTDATFFTPDASFTAHISIPGDHMVYNALAGIAVGCACGLTCEEIKAGIEMLKPVAGRNHMIRTEYLTIIDDCYNANPASMKSSLDVLATAKGRTVAILGDMFELGGNEIELHREIGAYTASLGIRVLITIGELSQNMAYAAEKTTLEVHSFSSKQDFFQNIKNMLHPGDTILVKASHGMGFAEIVKKLEELKF